MNRPYQWIHTGKKRYYAAQIMQDLFGEWILIKSWRSLSTKQGGCQRVACDSLTIAETKLAEIARRRRYRHYQPVTQQPFEEGPLKGFFG